MSMTVFYVPSLRKPVPRGELPPEIVFFPSGLRAISQEKESAAVFEARQAVARALPLTDGEARTVLEDMLRMGDELSPHGLLRQMAAWGGMPEKGGRAVRPDEAAALEAFAAGGAPSGREDGLKRTVTVPDWGRTGARTAAEQAAGVRDALVNCQKILLLADFLEERAAELTALEKRFHGAEAALAAALGEDAFQAEAEAGAALNADDEDRARDSSVPAVPWRVIVDAALPFLPEQALFFTADERMAADLREAGMLQPFPEDRADICAAWPRALASGLLFVCLPAWRLVGRRTLPNDRPWLDRDVEVVVARPQGGWI